MKRWCVIISILFAMLLIAGCIDVGSAPPARELAVISHDIIRGESGSVKVQVTVKNINPVMLELAQVTVSFYDAQKGLIDSSSDSVMNLRPGDIWDFEIECQGTRCSEVKGYEIETLAGTSSGGL